MAFSRSFSCESESEDASRDCLTDYGRSEAQSYVPLLLLATHVFVQTLIVFLRSLQLLLQLAHSHNGPFLLHCILHRFLHSTQCLETLLRFISTTTPTRK